MNPQMWDDLKNYCINVQECILLEQEKEGTTASYRGQYLRGEMSINTGILEEMQNLEELYK